MKQTDSVTFRNSHASQGLAATPRVRELGCLVSRSPLGSSALALDIKSLVTSLPVVETFGDTERGSAIAKDTVTTTLSKAVTKLRCELITEFEQLEQLSSDWERLWKSDPAGEIFQSFAWARAWWRAYGSQYSLHCLAVYDHDAIIGILPLVRYHDDLRFLGAPQADYTDVLCEEARTPEVLTAAFSALRASDQWNECKLEHLPSHSRIARYWRNSPHGLRRYSRLVFGYYCQTIMVRGESPDLLTKIAQKKKMRRHVNQLARLGKVKFRFIDTKLEAREHLAHFFRYHARRRILVGETSSCQMLTFQRLLEGLVDELDLRNELKFGAVEVNNSPVAYHFGFDNGGKFTLYQQTFDVDAWGYHPGNVLLHHMLLYAGERGAHEFDFTLGVEAYKTRYTNCVKQNLTLYLERSTLRGWIRCCCRTIQSRLYQKAVDARAHFQQYPKIYDPMDALRKWVLKSTADQLEGASTKPKRSGSLFGRIYKSIWQTQDRVLFRLEGKGPAEPVGATDGNIEVKFSRLSDIADLLLENHNFPGDLHGWRERIARGDQLLVVREDGKATLALWTTNDQSAIVSRSKKQAINFDLGRIAYELWSSLGADTYSSYRVALAFLVREAAKQDQSLWVCCPRKAEAQQKELTSRGFRPKYRLQDWHVFRWPHFQRITLVSEIASL
jgi:CelD/BcsL family acetyltransferase involved in cellulose biosynthesis